MNDVSSVGGGGGSSSVGSSSGASSSQASDTASVSSSSDTESASSKPESTLDRADSLQGGGSDSTPAQDALAGDSAISDPDNSREVAGAQSDAAESVTGPADASDPVDGTVEADDPATVAEEEVDAEMTPEEEARLEEYEAARAVLDEAALAAPGDLLDMPAIHEARAVVMGFDEEYRAVMGDLDTTFAALDKQVAYQSTFLANEGAMLQPDEFEAAKAFTEEEVAKAQAAFDEATKAVLSAIEEPAFKALLSDMEPAELQGFFEDMGRYMPASEVGRAWSADFTDGLAALGAQGQTSNAYAEMAVSLRDGLAAEAQRELDASLGLLVGTGLAERPQNADARLEAAAEALGLPEAEMAALRNPEGVAFEDLGAFTQTAAAAFNAFDALKAFDAPGNALGELATNLTYADLGMTGLSKLSSAAAASSSVGGLLGATQRGAASLMGVASGALSKASLAFSVVSTLDQIRQGNAAGTFDGALGVVGGALTIAGTGGWALAGYALVGAGLAMPAIRESANYQAFATSAVEAALGEAATGTLRGEMITYSPSYGVNLLDQLRPAGMSPADFLNSYIEKFNPEAIGMSPEIWGWIQNEAGAKELARLEAEALAAQ